MIPGLGGLTVLAFLLGLLAPVSSSRRAATPATERGEVLFSDSFDTGIRPEWMFDQDGIWTLEDGHLRAELPAQKQVRSFAFVGSETWKDYTVDFDVCGVRGVDKGIAVRVDAKKRAVGIDLRGAGYHDIVMYRGFDHWARGAVSNINGVWYHVHVEVKRNRYRVFVNDVLEIDFTDDANSRPRGRIALAAYTGGVGKCHVLYDNVEIRALR